MVRIVLLAWFVLAGLGAAGAPARADTAADVSALFSAKSVADRDAAVGALENANPKDPLVPYALGAADFLGALEYLSQELHRHGFESPELLVLPLLRLPVPENADPEPLTYDGFRSILVSFRDRLDAAAARLETVPDDVDFGAVVDLTQLGIDQNGDGAIAPDESVAAIMAAISGASGPADLTFRFDRADGYWLQGYANFLMAMTDFWLAHDFQNAFDNSFHVLFPRAELPLQAQLVPPPDSQTAFLGRIADLVSFVHLVDWPVVEPERRQTARLKLLEMIRLSRLDWQAIRAETDNDREWLPGPHQRGVNRLTGLGVEEAQVTGWHEALQTAEDLLEGRVLLPHPRIHGQGINVKAFFEAPQRFDLVLAVTGPGIIPYLENGTVLSGEDFERVRQQFGESGFMIFALWFN